MSPLVAALLLLLPHSSLEANGGGSMPLLQADYRQKHALLIGINHYSGATGADLLYASSDATELADVLKQGYGFQDVKTVTTGTTLESVSKALNDITSPENAKPDDLVLILFACHSEVSFDGSKGYFIMSDSKAGTEEQTLPFDSSTCLAMRDVRSLVQSCPARHTLIIADSCFSGVLISNRSTNISAGTANMSDIQARNFLSGRAKRLLSASDSDQTSREDPALQHGVLTAMLLREFYVRSEAVGELFDLTGLFDKVRASVVAYTNAMQRPREAAPDSDSDVIFRPTAALTPPKWLRDQPELRPKLAPAEVRLPSDVPADHWAASALQILLQGGLRLAYADNNFHGNRTTSRYEMATWTYSALRAAGVVNTNENVRLPSDVAPNAWFSDGVANLEAGGYLSNYPDGLFHGARPASRGEMAQLMASVVEPYLSKGARDASEVPTDVLARGPGEKKAIAQLLSAGLLRNFPDGLFRSNRPLSRYEMICMVSAVYTYIKERSR